MSWRYGRWSVEHAVPFGASDHLAAGDRVSAGDVVARGGQLGTPVRLAGPPDELRVSVGAEVRRGTPIARRGGRFGRPLTAPIDGLLVHREADGRLWLAPVLGRWEVRSAIDGVVARSDDASVVVEGDAWCLEGVAAYGPDAVGALVLAVDAPVDELQPQRIDVRSRGAILVGGARVAAEAITRAYACGVAACVAGAMPAGGLRAVYGEDVGADGLATRDDRPTVLCLMGFGTAALPDEVFRPFVAFSGKRAAVHTASARLFVFAPPHDAVAGAAPALVLADDHGGIRPLTGDAAVLGPQVFPSEVIADAILADGAPVPVANVIAFDVRR
ncbi:MAG TPA: hypothetical protein VFM93_04740 [Candidatus Limnocylindria bacterium]|nr:hypothetical protein [Candidatus Limnocylindria bacterium]